MDGVTIEEKSKITIEAEVRNRLIAECVHNVHTYFQSRAWEIFTEKFTAMSIKLPPDLISCKMCEEPIAGHYFEKEKRIVICANHVSDEQFENTLTHELVHLFDDARAEVDFKSPQHVACGEIRATNLSGECHQQFRFRALKSRKKYVECIKDRAIKSLMFNRHLNLSKEKAEDVVVGVWDVCYYDYEPFTTQQAKKKQVGQKY